MKGSSVGGGSPLFRARTSGEYRDRKHGAQMQSSTDREPTKSGSATSSDDMRSTRRLLSPGMSESACSVMHWTCRMGRHR